MKLSLCMMNKDVARQIYFTKNIINKLMGVRQNVILLIVATDDRQSLKRNWFLTAILLSHQTIPQLKWEAEKALILRIWRLERNGIAVDF